ncbi:sigma-54-dependent Fis family transcriptional regulator, partial [bacterium]|nr:sigma-54-dependent Fis family transcriptional regulator [bacterium]
MTEQEKQNAQFGVVERLVGRSEALEEIRILIRRVAGTKISVLLTGESGTGKDVVATMIHDLSPRREKPFVSVNCGAIPEGLFESEMFGHERGSFTGA